MNVCTLNTNLIFMIVKNLVNDKKYLPPPPSPPMPSKTSRKLDRSRHFGKYARK